MIVVVHCICPTANTILLTSWINKHELNTRGLQACFSVVGVSVYKQRLCTDESILERRMDWSSCAKLVPTL